MKAKDIRPGDSVDAEEIIEWIMARPLYQPGDVSDALRYVALFERGLVDEVTTDHLESGTVVVTLHMGNLGASLAVPGDLDLEVERNTQAK